MHDEHYIEKKRRKTTTTRNNKRIALNEMTKNYAQTTKLPGA